MLVSILCWSYTYLEIRKQDTYAESICKKNSHSEAKQLYFLTMVHILQYVSSKVFLVLAIIVLSGFSEHLHRTWPYTRDTSPWYQSNCQCIFCGKSENKVIASAQPCLNTLTGICSSKAHLLLICSAPLYLHPRFLR